MNKAFLVGRLTRDPELTLTKTGKNKCVFTVAVSRRQRQTDGAEASADFVSCVAWNRDAENLCMYMRKGSRVAVEGEIHTGSYERDGRRVYTTDVWCNQIDFLSTRDERADEYQAPKQQDMIEQAQDDDLPF